MRVLVTGATGLVGNNCVRTLLQQSDDVHVLIRKHSDSRPLDGLPITVHHGDLSDTKLSESMIPEVDAIIHSAADTHIGRDPRPSQHQLNVHGTQFLAETAHSRGIRFVFVSSVDALPAGRPDRLVDEDTDGPPKYACGYVSTKREAEEAVQRRVEQGLDATIVNPGFMLGPWDWKPSSGRMLLQVATRFTPFGPKGGYSVCDVRDVADAIVRIATASEQLPHRRYILAGTNMTYVEAWRTFANVAGRRGPLCPAGPLMRIVAGKCGDFWTRIAGKEGDVNSAAIRMSELYHYYDSSRAIRDLDYQIRPVEESVEATWTWFREHGYC